MDRREWLWQAGGGLGGIAWASLLARDGLLEASSPTTPSTTTSSTDGRRSEAGPLPGIPHHPPKARAVIQLFMSGAASQVDTFDYKPLLTEKQGQPFDPGGQVELFQSSPGHVMPSPWTFRRHGHTGRWVSDLLPHLAGQVDRMAFIYSMVSRSNVHGPATFLQSTGFLAPGFPSAGSWISYGLGRLSDDLPTFVVLPDARGFPPNGPKNWGNGFLPASHQGTMVRPAANEPIRDLVAPNGSFVTEASDREGLRVLEALNQRHRVTRAGDDRLEARMASYEMAARLQQSAPELLDLAGETDETHRLYGLDEEETRDFGRNCLLARRMVERGVRFVQVWNGADNGFPRRNWDSHEDLARDHATMGRSLDRPAAALIEDLARRGLLEETIVLWTTEFGRMPCSQGNAGRDHNPFTFTNWLAGGGIRPGATRGESDPWSYKAAVDPTECYDVHATLLHLLGIDHTRLTVRHQGIDRRLTDVHGRVLDELIV